MDYKEYIRTELIILIPVMYLIGTGLKKSKVADRWIPSILGAVSVLLAAIWVISTGDIHNCKECASAVLRLLRREFLQQEQVYILISYMYSQKSERRDMI